MYLDNLVFIINFDNYVTILIIKDFNFQVTFTLKENHNYFLINLILNNFKEVKNYY